MIRHARSAMTLTAVALVFTATSALAADDKSKKAADLSGREAAAQMQAMPKPGAKSDRAMTMATTAAAGAPVAAGVRDWAAIDRNRDNLISAEEMETWLEAQRKAK
jgi:hypothetical protein